MPEDFGKLSRVSVIFQRRFGNLCVAPCVMAGGQQGHLGVKAVSSHLCDTRINYNWFQHWFIRESFLMSSEKYFKRVLKCCEKKFIALWSGK